MSAPQAANGKDSAQARKGIFSRNRDFFWLWSGESISLLGSEISVIAIPSLAILTFGEGALGVGLLVALQWLPFVVLAPFMGVLIDRMRRRPLMQFANAARFAILGSLPLAAVLDVLTVQHLYAAALLKGVFDVVFQLAYQAYMPQILDRADLADGNAKTQISRSVAMMVGRSLGGGLVSLLGAARAIFADAVSYLIAVFALRAIKHEEPAPEPARPGLAATLADLRGGVAITFGNRLLRHLTLMATFGNMAVSMVLAMLVVFAYEDLGFSGGLLGLALGIGAAPIVLGAILSRRLNERLGMGRTLVLTHALLGLAFVLLPLASLGGRPFAFATIMLCEGLASFTVPIANVGIMTLIQMATPPQAMGRVGGVALPFVWGSNAVGPLLGSAVAAAVGANTAAFFLAALLAWSAIGWILTGRVQRITHEVPEKERVVI